MLIFLTTYDYISANASQLFNRWNLSNIVISGIAILSALMWPKITVVKQLIQKLQPVNHKIPIMFLGHLVCSSLLIFLDIILLIEAGQPFQVLITLMPLIVGSVTLFPGLKEGISYNQSTWFQYQKAYVVVSHMKTPKKLHFWSRLTPFWTPSDRMAYLCQVLNKICDFLIYDF